MQLSLGQQVIQTALTDRQVLRGIVRVFVRHFTQDNNAENTAPLDFSSEPKYEPHAL
jgi:hypothetical protein